MYRCNVVCACAVVVAVTLCSLSSYAADSDPAPNPAPRVSDNTSAKEEVRAPECPGQDWRNRWFLFYGVSNLHGEIKESEKIIDSQLNNTLGRVIPGWRKPITFHDWSDDFRLWDLHLGAGRDINEHLSWFASIGGSAGTIVNHEDYQSLLIPLKAKMDFTRMLYFTSAGLTCYPFGKPALRPEGGWFMRSILGSRPFVEVAACYVRLKAVADVKLVVPGVVDLFKKYQETSYDLFYGSPRIGIETPITENDSVALEAGYLFFTSHHEEFDNFSVYLIHRHKF